MSSALAMQPASLDQKVSMTLLWLEDMREPSKWDLSQEDACELMGGITRNTYRGWVSKANNGEPVSISRDQLTRLSLIAGIHKALFLSSPNGYEYDFFKRPIDHPMFEGTSAKDFLLNDCDILTMFAVRNHFDARRA